MADRFSLDTTPAELADVEGFKSGAAECGLKPDGPDLGVILCEDEGCGTALFSRNASRGASVQVSRPRALAGRLRAVIANAGNANCFTGEQGFEDARQMISLAAEGLLTRPRVQQQRLTSTLPPTSYLLLPPCR